MLWSPYMKRGILESKGPEKATPTPYDKNLDVLLYVGMR
jgi:hypothetical protein